MSIVFDQVTKKLGGNIVIDNISCVIKSNHITGLKGINGSGKTMMMRLIAGLIYPSSGNVVVDGKIMGKDISFPPSIGVMLENPSFLNSYSGYENLKMLSDINKVISPSTIHETLFRVGLGDAERKKYRKYSLGMKQRLGIAAAIMEHPSILLLDEPTNALDTNGIILVKDIIREEKKRGATIVISCHDTQTLEDLADDILFIEGGRIVNQ